MKLLIGCPIYQRDWILPHWFRCVESQSINLEDVGFIFVASSEDKETLMHLETWKSLRPQVKLFDIILADNLNHFSHQEGTRHWTLSKYENMVNLRNILLSKVREYEPDYFFSLDSDILLTNPNTIELLISHIKEGADAVSPLMFMTPSGTRFPSIMKWIDKPGGKAGRDEDFPLGDYFKVDVIMAAKMMSKDVYKNINYIIHEQGEDLGWSAECAEKGYSLYSASYIYASHVMSRSMLNDLLRDKGDPRVGVSMKNLSKA